MMGYTKSIALLFMLVIVIAHFSPSDAFWGRRRRRRCHTPHKPVGKHWANNWDGKMYFQCPYSQAMTSVYSLYSTCHRDRVWSFGCAANIAAQTCQWSHYVNNFDDPIRFHCLHNGFITGIRSIHHNHYEDRRFMFRCCYRHGYVKYNCETRPFDENEFRATIDFRARPGYYITGMSSYHNNHFEDRKWAIETCAIKRIFGRDEPNVDEAAKEVTEPDTQMISNAEDVGPEENTEENGAYSDE